MVGDRTGPRITDRRHPLRILARADDEQAMVRPAPADCREKRAPVLDAPFLQRRLATHVDRNDWNAAEPGHPLTAGRNLSGFEREIEFSLIVQVDGAEAAELTGQALAFPLLLPESFAMSLVS